MEKKYYIYGNELLKWRHDGKLYAAKIRSDPYPEDPREGDGQLTVMACLHGRYKLGDDIGVKTEEDFYRFFRRLVVKHVSDDELIERFLNGKISGIRVEKTSEPDLYDIYFDGFTARNVERRRFRDEVVDELTIEQCFQALEGYVEWLPLWLYDHSGITMSCGSRSGQFADRWDSCCAGFIIAEKDVFLKDAVEILRDENGKDILIEHKHEGHPSTYSVACRPLTEETWRARAIEIMREDVRIYDQYLTNEVYGYSLYEADEVEDGEEPDWEEIDTCVGFYGDDLMENGILDAVGSGLAEAIENGTLVKDSTIRFDREPVFAR